MTNLIMLGLFALYSNELFIFACIITFFNIYLFEYKKIKTLNINSLNKKLYLLLTHQNVYYRIYTDQLEIDNFLNLEGLLTTDEDYNRQLYKLYINNADALKLLNNLDLLYLLRLTRFDTQKDIAQLSSKLFGVATYDIEQQNPAYIVFFDKQVENSIKLIDYTDI